MAPVDLSNDTKNWLKAALALKHLKKGLLPFVDNQISAFQNNLKATYGTCNQCSTENVLKCPTINVCWKRNGICQYHDHGNPLIQSRPCPNGVCDQIRDAIVNEHFKAQPMWKNTDAKKWSSNAWEVAKCFLPPGSKDAASSSDTDCTGILSLCLHCKPLTDLIDPVKHKFETNRTNRNTLMHSGRQELSDADRTAFIQDAVDLVSTYQSPPDQKTQHCIDTLNTIDSGSWLLTTDDIVGVLEDKVDALRLKQEGLEADLKSTIETVHVNKDAISDHQTELNSYKGDIKKMDDELKAANSILQRLDLQNDAKQIQQLRNDMEEIRTNNENICKQINQRIDELERKVQTMEQNIVTLDNKQEEHQRRLTRVDTNIVTLDNKHEEHEQRLTSVDTNIVTLDNKHEEHEQRLTSVDTNIVTLDNKQEEQHKEHERRLTRVDTNIVTLDNKHEEHEQRLTSVDTNIVTLDNKQEEQHKEHERRLTRVDTTIVTLDNKHEEHERRLARVDTNIETIDNKHDAHERRLTRVDKNIETLDNKHDVQHKEHETRLTMVDTNIETLDNKHEEHERRLTRVDQRLSALDMKKEVSSQHPGHELDGSTDKKMRAEADMVPPTDRQDIQKMQGRKLLREYLIKKYTKNYSDVPVAPPKQDMWTTLREHYREQQMVQVSMPDESQTRKGEEEKHDTVNSYNDVFCRDGKQCRNIYVKGDAGSGKSVFCQHMANKWCDIHSSAKEQDGSRECVTPSNEQKNIDSLHQFDFLFYITLKHATRLSDIVSMIKENLLNNNRKLLDQLADVLENDSEKCLILIDGLDEWSPPEGSKESPFVTFGLPDRDDSYDWTILTTTRPWKLETIRPKRSEMDQLIELSGLTEMSVGETIISVVDYLNKRYPEKDKSNKSSDDCLEHLYARDLSHIMTFPIMLNTLVCIWFEDGDVGKTKCDMYAAMVDVFLMYAAQKKNIKTPSNSDEVTECSNLPACFRNRNTRQRFKQLLFKLSKLAFHTLFCKDRSSSLVFETCTTDIHGMSNTEVDFWLDIGLLSQDSVDTRSTKNDKILSFPHKTIQEFLAAVYISMHTDSDNDVLPVVKDICGSVDMILEMSQVFVFLSGMAPAIVTTISRYISQVVSADEDIQRYRSTCNSQWFSREYTLVRNIQLMVVNCIKESVDTGLTNIEVHIQDVIIENGAINEWFRFNKSDIISVVFQTSPRIYDLVQQIGMKQIQAIIDDMLLSKIELNGPSLGHGNDDAAVVAIVPIIRSSMTTLAAISLNSVLLKLSTHKALCDVLSFSCAQDLQFKHVTNPTAGLRELSLNAINCSGCGTGCTCRLDLSRLTQLETLKLQELHVSEVQINTTQMKTCTIDTKGLEISSFYIPIPAEVSLIFHGDGRKLGCLTLSYLVLKHEQLEQLMLFVTQATGLREITLNDIKCSDCVTGCTCRLDLSRLTQLETLKLQELHVSEVQINTTQMKTCTIYIKGSEISSFYPPIPAEVSLIFHGDGRKLGSLTLRYLALKHEQLEQLMLFVKQATGLRDITLTAIKCSDCGNGDTCRLDLSRHTQLETLVLNELHVSEIEINTTQMVTCTIDRVGSTISCLYPPRPVEVSLIFHGDGRKLGRLTLEYIVLKHEQLEQLMLFVTQATGLREITLDEIKCSDCGTGDTCRLDLSRHIQLEWLVLEELRVSEVLINTTQMATCTIDTVGSPEISSMYNALRPAEVSLIFHGDGRTLGRLTLKYFVLKHEQLEQLMLFVTQATGLREISLTGIKCSDCGTGRTCRLDLSRHTQLETLQLEDLHVNEVHINTTWLKRCIIDSLRPASRTPNNPGYVGVSLTFCGDIHCDYGITLYDIALRHEHLKMLFAQLTNSYLNSSSGLRCVDCADNCELIVDYRLRQR